MRQALCQSPFYKWEWSNLFLLTKWPCHDSNSGNQTLEPILLPLHHLDVIFLKTFFIRLKWWQLSIVPHPLTPICYAVLIFFFLKSLIRVFSPPKPIFLIKEEDNDFHSQDISSYLQVWLSQNHSHLQGVCFANDLDHSY